MKLLFKSKIDTFRSTSTIHKKSLKIIAKKKNSQKVFEHLENK